MNENEEIWITFCLALHSKDPLVYPDCGCL